MKKGLTTLLVILLAVGAMLVSCKAEVATPADELVSVSFEEAASRSITATLETFNKDAYYWKYAAKKADDSGLTSGATAYDIDGALPVSQGNPGLGSGRGTEAGYKAYKVAGFSQGQWNFKLWAYKTNDNGVYKDLVFYGEAKNVTLTRGGDNTAKVTVNPVAEGNGYIKIGEITFIPKKGTDTQYTVSKFIEVTNPDGSAVSGLSYDADTQTYTVPAGAYKVTVKFANAAQTIVYGEGYVIATVYSGLKTTIAGDLDELVTYAQFDADLNPDAVKVQALSALVGVGTGDALGVSGSTGSGESLKTVTTEVARADVNKIIQQMADEQAIPVNPDPTDGAYTKVQLALNVDPTDATETSVTYEIGMEATLTYKASSTADEQVSNKPITDLDKAIIIEISMQTGLTSVKVKHSGNDMTEVTSVDDLVDGKYYYDGLNGVLYICTDSFSPFAISYKAPTNYVAKVGDVKYATLAAAVQKADADHPVELIADVALTDTVIVDKSLTLKLNGFNITAADCRAIHVQEGTLKLTGKGTIAANKVASNSEFRADSSVIRVGDNAGTAAGLEVGENVTISSSHCYGVSIFGKEAEGQKLVVDGKIRVTGTASAISGNGTKELTANSITINEHAEIYAENDYAIYHPQRGTLTVAGGTIEGKGGIETKGGNVIINGGAITATAPTQSHEEYNNGASTSGYALASVENKNYPGEANIYVSGGTVNGKIIVLKDTEATFDPVIEISGGTYTVKPASEYLAKGFVAIENEDGTWSVLPKVVQDATEYGLIVSGYGIETWQPSYGKVTKKGMTFADGTFDGDKTVYRYYADGKIYIYDVSEVEGTSYTFREDVSGIRGYWSNDTINEITINSPIEQAYKKFEGNTTITKVNFGKKATRIANRMFYAAKGLTDVTLPSVAYIESSAFQKSYITSIVIEAPVVVIEDTAFAACPNLVTIDIKGAATIGTEGANNFVARNCPKLTAIYLRGEGTTFIGNESMTFTHEENGNDGGAGITLHAANSSVYDALVAFSGDSVTNMTVKYPNNN